jgi:hypothetical protein
MAFSAGFDCEWIQGLESRLLFCGSWLQPQELSLSAATPGASGGSVPVIKHPLSSLPTLSSLPGAQATLYLDFNGDYEPSWGGYHPGFTPAIDSDGDPTTFTDAELTTIQQTWEAVAEDYSPFNLNVTTVDPGNRDDFKTQAIVIGGDGSWYGSAGGVSFVGSFSNSDPNVGFVFLNTNANFIAAAASHEAGHGFGLQHQSAYDGDGNKTDEYSHGDSTDAPIMGYGYAARNVWWSGPSSIASWSMQNDVSIIASSENRFGYRTDDYPDSPGAGTQLTGAGLELSAPGVIGQSTDQDWFTFSTPAGAGSISVDVSPRFADLDARLELRAVNGALITSLDTNSLGESMALNFSGGTYRLGVMSRHYADTSAAGFVTRVGDIGQYNVHVTLPPVQTPYKGVPFAIAASGTTTIQAEDFDLGGESLAYHDLTKPNQGGAYRPGDAVDIKPAADSGGGYRLSDVLAGEWVEYTINVAQSGTYDFGFRVASPDPGGKLHAEIDRKNFTRSISVPDTNSYSSFRTLMKNGVALTAGTHVLRLAFDANAWPVGVTGAFNWIGITRAPISSQLTLAAAAGSFVRDGTFASTNFGSAPMFQVKNTPYHSYTREAYLKFDLTGVGPFTSAKLQLYGQTEDAQTHNLTVGIYALNNPLADWSENGLTWNNRPTSGGAPMATTTITDSTLRRYQIDLTNYLKSQKSAGRTSVTLVIKMPWARDRFVQFASDDSAGNAPQLVFTT